METEHRRFVGAGAIGGLLIITVGVILLLHVNGIIEAHDILRYWPLALLAFGILKLIEPSGSRAFGVVLTIIGAAFSLRTLGYVRFHFTELWPVVLITIGVLMLWRSIEGGGTFRRRFGPDFRQPASAGRLREWAIFGGGERQVVSKEFEGGELLCIFGGWNIDLSRAEMKGDEATIDANFLFGGANIRIPESWDVEVRTVGIFGGVGDKTRHPRGDEPGGVKRLILTGSTMFGGIEVKN